MTELEVPDNWVVLESVTIIKALDAEGIERVHHECSEGLNSWEAIGMCIWTSDVLRSTLSSEIE